MGAEAPWDDAAWAETLARLASEGTIVASGVQMGPDTLARILRTVPEKRLRAADFQSACFDGFVDFSGFHFGTADFHNVTFRDVANFMETTFDGSAMFAGSSFGGEARFERAAFHDDAAFDACSFGRRVSFAETDFQRGAGFSGASLAEAQFPRVRWGGQVDFSRASCAQRAAFHQGLFQDEADFTQAHFGSDVDFAWSSFERTVAMRSTHISGALIFDGTLLGTGVELTHALVGGDLTLRSVSGRDFQRLGPLTVGGRVVLDESHFEDVVALLVRASGVSCADTNFQGGGTLRARPRRTIAGASQTGGGFLGERVVYRD